MVQYGTILYYIIKIKPSRQLPPAIEMAGILASWPVIHKLYMASSIVELSVLLISYIHRVGPISLNVRFCFCMRTYMRYMCYC